MKPRIFLLISIGLAVAGCTTTAYYPEGNSAHAQLGPNFPRGK